jgi:hypothetical protein
LKEVIKSSDPEVRIYVKNGQNRGKIHSYYSFTYATEGKEWTHTHGTIESIGLDSIVLDMLREHLRSSEAEQDFQDFAMIEPKVIKEANEELELIKRDIEATKANMARIKAQVESGQLTDPDLAQAANGSYAAAKTELKRLEERKASTERIAQEDDERRTYKALMYEVDEAWDDVVLPEEHPRLVYLFIESVTLARVSPSFCTMRVEWKDPAWEADEALFYKGSTAYAKWEEDEVALLEDHYLTASWEELAILFPTRSRRGLYDYYQNNRKENPRKANGLSCGLSDLKGQIPCSICLADWKIMQEHDITLEEFQKFDGAKLITCSK